jgi:hypothetical protein
MGKTIVGSSATPASPRAYHAAAPFGQHAVGNARTVVATALLFVLALAGFAAAQPFATPGGVRFEPFCSETCPLAQTTNPPRVRPAGPGRGRHRRFTDARSVERRA